MKKNIYRIIAITMVLSLTILAPTASLTARAEGIGFNPGAHDDTKYPDRPAEPQPAPTPAEPEPAPAPAPAPSEPEPAPAPAPAPAEPKPAPAPSYSEPAYSEPSYSEPAPTPAEPA